jgi:hypothetical protein
MMGCPTDWPLGKSSRVFNNKFMAIIPVKVRVWWYSQCMYLRSCRQGDTCRQHKYCQQKTNLSTSLICGMQCNFRLIRYRCWPTARNVISFPRLYQELEENIVELLKVYSKLERSFLLLEPEQSRYLSHSPNAYFIFIFYTTPR